MVGGRTGAIGVVPDRPTARALDRRIGQGERDNYIIILYIILNLLNVYTMRTRLNTR